MAVLARLTPAPAPKFLPLCSGVGGNPPGSSGGSCRHLGKGWPRCTLAPGGSRCQDAAISRLTSKSSWGSAREGSHTAHPARFTGRAFQGEALLYSAPHPAGKAGGGEASRAPSAQAAAEWGRFPAFWAISRLAAGFQGLRAGSEQGLGVWGGVWGGVRRGSLPQERVLATRSCAAAPQEGCFGLNQPLSAFPSVFGRVCTNWIWLSGPWPPNPCLWGRMQHGRAVPSLGMAGGSLPASHPLASRDPLQASGGGDLCS